MISHRILPILPPNFTKFVSFFVSTKKLSSNLESPIYVANAKSGREMVTENEEIIMEKSWEIL